MASNEAQTRWRQKHRYTKTQLNVMVRRLVHRDLEETAARFHLRGKGEAVSFASFIAKGLAQYADHDPHARQLLDIFTEGYERERDLYG